MLVNEALNARGFKELLKQNMNRKLNHKWNMHRNLNRKLLLAKKLKHIKTRGDVY
jgi:hypothetical protein